MDKLITDLEAAPGGSKKLDVAIYKLVSGLEPSERDPDWIGPDDGWNHGSWVGRAPQYTTSLDAALTLIPEGWAVQGLYQAFTGQWWGASVRLVDRPADGCCSSGKGRPTPALAMCVAALKARQAAEELA